MMANIKDNVKNLALARLLGSKDKPLGFKTLRHDLSELFGVHVTGEQLDRTLVEVVKDLLTADLIGETGKATYQLTESGLRAAKSYLRADYLPRRIDWRIVKDQYLLAKALGLTISSAKELKKIKAETMRAVVVKKALGLDLPDLPTASQAMGSASWYALGIRTRDSFNLSAVRCHLLNQLLEATRPVDEQQAFKLLAATKGGARNSSAQALRKALLESLVAPATDTRKSLPVQTSNQEEGIVDSHLTDLEEFALKVLQAAAGTPTGRHGLDKVFISHVWKHWQRMEWGQGMTMSEFKDQLIEAHRARKLTLSEADLPDQLNHSDVEASVIHYLNARFHFIRLGRCD